MWCTMCFGDHKKCRCHCLVFPRPAFSTRQHAMHSVRHLSSSARLPVLLTKGHRCLFTSTSSNVSRTGRKVTPGQAGAALTVGALALGCGVSLTRRSANQASSSSIRWLSTSPSTGGGGGLLAAYSRLLDTNPLLTKCSTSVVIGGAGDVLCQLFVDKCESFEWRRLFNMAFLSGALVGPTLHVWYGFLASKIPGATWTAVAQRLALDQLVFAPTFVGIFFVSMAAVQGVPGEAVNRLKSGWTDAVITNYKLWPAAQVINFRFVPVQHQVLFANMIAVVWNTYLSWATNKQSKAPAKE